MPYFRTLALAALALPPPGHAPVAMPATYTLVTIADTTPMTVSTGPSTFHRPLAESTFVGIGSGTTPYATSDTPIPTAAMSTPPITQAYRGGPP